MDNLSAHETFQPRSSEPTKLLRLRQIIGPNGYVPVSRAQFYSWIAEGIAPKPVRIAGSRISFWRLSDIQQMIAEAQHVSG